MTEITQLLRAIDQGDAHSAHDLLPLVYEELRKLAAAKMAREAPGQTLQPTALVHEAWLKLAGGAAFRGRAHFFGAAAEAMRRILIDRARRRSAQRHGGGLERVEETEIAAPAAEEELLAVDEALDRFAAVDPQKGGAGEAPFLHRLDHRRSGRYARHFGADSEAVVGLRPGLAVRGLPCQ